MAFTPWDPLRDLLTLHEQFGQLVGADGPGWTPLVDLYETSAEYVLAVELPGVTRDQIELEAEDQRIVISGRRDVENAPCEQYHRLERGHGRFSRAFTLPEPIQVDQIRADLKDGVLTVALPKALDRGVRRVQVS